MVDPGQEYVTAAGYMFDRVLPLFQKAVAVENGAYSGLMKKMKMKAAIESYDKILGMAQSAQNSIQCLHLRNDDGFEENVENMYAEFILTVVARKQFVQSVLNGANIISLNAIDAESKKHLTAFQICSDLVLQMVQKN